MGSTPTPGDLSPEACSSVLCHGDIVCACVGLSTFLATAMPRRTKICTFHLTVGMGQIP